MPRDPDLPEFDTRPSIRLVDTAPEHPKIVGLSDKSFRVWIEIMCYCSRQKTNGKVSSAAIKKQGPPKAIRELVDSGLLVPTVAGYEVHDYLQHNRSASEIESFRESKSEAGALGAHKRWHIPRRQYVKGCQFCDQEVRSA